MNKKTMGRGGRKRGAEGGRKYLSRDLAANRNPGRRGNPHGGENMGGGKLGSWKGVEVIILATRKSKHSRLRGPEYIHLCITKVYRKKEKRRWASE